jgi:alkanesulfonate monooxygenase SsuD/methylene tetrahydromethanopterin reductase-like flavin-dependent oxidoreductase (luciferase family)
VKFGVFLPSYIQRGQTERHPERLRDFARHAEALGFDSLWITDHIVTAHRFYSVSWLDSLMTLSHVAAITERVRLGTSILILPVRQPAVLAKEIATLHYLSGSRYIYGIGAGWYGPEFAACGVDKSERGTRTDEVLAATLALFERPDV